MKKLSIKILIPLPWKIHAPTFEYVAPVINSHPIDSLAEFWLRIVSLKSVGRTSKNDVFSERCCHGPQDWGEKETELDESVAVKKCQSDCDWRVN